MQVNLPGINWREHPEARNALIRNCYCIWRKKDQSSAGSEIQSVPKGHLWRVLTIACHRENQHRNTKIMLKFYFFRKKLPIADEDKAAMKYNVEEQKVAWVIDEIPEGP